MELGTAIFLSSIAISVVLLYGFTKDRWSWRRVFFRSFVAILVIASVSAVMIFAAQYWNQIFPTKLNRQAEYAGVRLGMSRDEVRYVKGVPTLAVIQDKEGPSPSYNVFKPSELPKGKTINDYPLWEYEGHEHFILVIFGDGNNTVRSVACFSSDKSSRCPEIGGVSDGTTEAELLHKFGMPSSSQIKDARKSVRYEDIGVEFTLEKQKVYRLIIGPTPML